MEKKLSALSICFLSNSIRRNEYYYGISNIANVR